MAFAPLTALAPGASRMLERLAPPPETTDTAPAPARPWQLLVARLPRAGRALSLLLPVGPDVRPVGVDHLGPRGRAPRPRDHDRPELEAAAGHLHDAVQPRGRRRRAAAVARRGAGGRHPRVRDGLPARQAPGRAGRGADRRGLADPRRRVHPQLLPRQLRGHPRRALPVGDRAPPRRPPPRRVPARPRRRAAAARGVAVHRALRPLSDRRRLAPREAAAGQDDDPRDRWRPRPGHPLVRAGVPRIGRLPARRGPRAQAQPGLAPRSPRIPSSRSSTAARRC